MMTNLDTYIKHIHQVLNEFIKSLKRILIWGRGSINQIVATNVNIDYIF
jgi:hypothetical protein